MTSFIKNQIDLMHDNVQLSIIGLHAYVTLKVNEVTVSYLTKWFNYRSG